MIPKKQQQQELEENIRFFRERFPSDAVGFSLPPSLQGERLTTLLETELPRQEKSPKPDWLLFFNTRRMAMACALVAVVGLTFAFSQYAPSFYGIQERGALEESAQAMPEAAAFSLDNSAPGAAPDSPDTPADGAPPESASVPEGAPILQAAPRMTKDAPPPAKPNPCGSQVCTLPADAVFAASTKEIKDTLIASLAADPQAVQKTESTLAANRALASGQTAQVGGADVSYHQEAHQVVLSANGKETTLLIGAEAQVVLGDTSLSVVEQKQEGVQLILYRVAEDGTPHQVANHLQQGTYLDLVSAEEDTYSLVTYLPVTEKMIETDDFLPEFNDQPIALDAIQMKRFPDYTEVPEYTIFSTITPAEATAFAVLNAKAE